MSENDTPASSDSAPAAPPVPESEPPAVVYPGFPTDIVEKSAEPSGVVEFRGDAPESDA